MFERKYIYLSVCFPGGKHPYSYRTNDSTIRINDVVIVPTQEGEKAAIVTSVRLYNENDVPYPLDKTKFIVRRASRGESAPFAGIDMRMPLDISTKKVKTPGGEATVVTSKEERADLRKRYAGKTELKLTEKYPVSMECRIIDRNDLGKSNKIAILKRREHLWGSVTYECSACRTVFPYREAFCPHCHAEFSKTKSDPVWVDEMADYAGDL